MKASIGNRYSLTRVKVNSLLLTLGLMSVSPQVISASPTDSKESRQTSEDVMSMSLKELLQVKYTVDTASKKQQSIAEAPAIISVLTAEDIKRRGVSNLYEAIATLPGANLVGSFFGYSMLNFRGGQQETYNNSVLLLINGHPSSEGDFGSFHLELIPINIVERIEVIRGPGSALYGTNALEGVINIITKTPIKSTAEVTLGAGSDDHVEVAAWWGNDKFRLAVSGSKNNGYDFSGTLDEPTGGGSFPVNLKDHNRIANLFFDYEGEAVRINAAYFQQDKFIFGVIPEIDVSSEHDFDAGYIDIKYNKRVGEGDLVSRVRYDYLNRRSNVPSTTISPFPFILLKESDNYGIELEYYREIKGIDFIGGLDYQSVSSLGNYRVFKTPTGDFLDHKWKGASGVEDFSAYFQAITSPLDNLSLIIGGRFNKSDTGNTTFVPRLGLSYFYNPEMAFKLLYSEAYRTPDLFERYASAGVTTATPIRGTPDLDAEQINTLDLGIDYTLSRRYTLRANLFYQQRTDSIKRVPNTTEPLVANDFANEEGDDSYGLELDLDGYINPELSIYANISAINGFDNSSDKEINGLINLSGNAGLNYQLSERLNTSFNLQYVREQENRLNSGENTVIDDYWLANLVGEYRMENLSLRATVKNIGDTEYTYPEYIRANIKDIPGGAGRSFYLNASYEF